MLWRGRFRFDAETHTYTVGGQRVPSVTECCPPARGAEFFRDEDRERGHAVHRATLDHDLGAEPDVDTISLAAYVRLRAYVQWRQESRGTLVRGEQPTVNRTIGLAGTPDRVFLLLDGFEWIVDIKSGAPDYAHQVQTAGYDLLLDDVPPRTRRRAALYLRRTGTFRFVPHDNPADYAEFARKARTKGVLL